MGEVRKSSWSYRRAWPLIAIGAGLLCFFLLGGGEWLSLDLLRARHRDLAAFVADHYALSVAGFILIYVVVVALSIPGATILTLAGGYLFGVIPATCYIVVGATAGATIVFLAARSSLGDLLRAKAGPWFAKLADGFQRDAWSYMLILRLVPLFPFFVINLVPAFLGVRLRIFVWTTFIGIIPATLVYATLGSGLGQILDSDAAISTALSPTIIAALLGLAALSAAPLILRRIRGRQQ